MPEPTRVLLVDDHAMMRAGFRAILDSVSDIEVVGEASTGREALERTAALRPDVVCMDVQMPDMDGLEATRRIVADPEATASVVVVTTFDRDDYLFAALAAGASGFLLKNAGPEQLIAAVRLIAGGDALLSPEVTRRVIARFATEHAAADAGDLPTTGPVAGGAASAPAPAQEPNRFGLTDREDEVLRLMAEALSNAEIAERLFIGESTVKTHVSNVLLKLGARDRVQAIVYAYRARLV
ncbi:response regulator transcription factor [Microbacterium sp. SORGH_AS_0888]|uniref:response regulator n=1 Tax=Microbacterium sp. SORGH_AS_0888 TaxID=3041791 RepID=UPI002781114C|nr:response regulator transcription factor [Microbacterium sp. SORGH_AS_0888]MDQ1129776.1 DNA-binding NarL/FixJ family response regulator [Microbacterium sp. SORGH_AS_0888]